MPQKHARGLICVVLVSASLGGCGLFKKRDQERAFQSKMIQALNSKTSDFANCAKRNRLFDAFKKERVRVEMKLDIGDDGKVERFQIDNKPYPSKFADCMFTVAESISFPAPNKGEVVELTQPFIFSR